MARKLGSPPRLAASSAAEPPLMVSDVVMASLAGSTTSTFLASLTTFFFTGVGSGGGGAITSLPSLQQTMDLTMMSPSSAPRAEFTFGMKASAPPLPVMWFDMLSMFWAYIAEAWRPILPARSVYPMMVTPLSVTYFSPALVSVQLPPPAAARSTMTLPGFMSFTMYSSISTGDFLPGIAAVEIMMSHSLACLWKVSFCACWNSGLDSLA
mmetsp:Transcript_105909/g.287464  ORF Transcript_105909/g.287464 Transcript_105909/m.287464 type:complete len:210 (+) Transcript_105909:252-881(+)